jgi:hypothetical protein
LEQEADILQERTGSFISKIGTGTAILEVNGSKITISEAQEWVRNNYRTAREMLNTSDYDTIMVMH